MWRASFSPTVPRSCLHPCLQRPVQLHKFLHNNVLTIKTVVFQLYINQRLQAATNCLRYNITITNVAILRILSKYVTYKEIFGKISDTVLLYAVGKHAILFNRRLFVCLFICYLYIYIYNIYIYIYICSNVYDDLLHFFNYSSFYSRFIYIFNSKVKGGLGLPLISVPLNPLLPAHVAVARPQLNRGKY